MVTDVNSAASDVFLFLILFPYPYEYTFRCGSSTPGFHESGRYALGLKE
jgi:hypothetical protein